MNRQKARAIADRAKSIQGTANNRLFLAIKKDIAENASDGKYRLVLQRAIPNPVKVWLEGLQFTVTITNNTTLIEWN